MRWDGLWNNEQKGTPDMKYYISDLHLFHENAIKFDNRPFSSIPEMHAVVYELYTAYAGRNYGAGGGREWDVEEMNFGEYARAFFKHTLECKTSETVLPGCANQRKRMVNKKGSKIEKMGKRKNFLLEKDIRNKICFSSRKFFRFHKLKT